MKKILVDNNFSEINKFFNIPKLFNKNILVLSTIYFENFNVTRSYYIKNLNEHKSYKLDLKDCSNISLIKIFFEKLIFKKNNLGNEINENEIKNIFNIKIYNLIKFKNIYNFLEFFKEEDILFNYENKKGNNLKQISIGSLNNIFKNIKNIEEKNDLILRKKFKNVSLGLPIDLKKEKKVLLNETLSEKYRNESEYEKLIIQEDSFFKKYILILEKIKMEDIDEEFKKVDDLMTTWTINNFKINQNFKNDFNILNCNNPYKNLEFINIDKNIENLKKYENICIATSYFKNCGSPLCKTKNDNDNHKCNCNIKIKYFISLCSTILCDIYFRGFHGFHFYPTKLYIRKNPFILKEINYEKPNLEIKNNMENKIKEIYKKYSYPDEYEDESFLIDNKQISNLKNRKKKKEIGDKSKSFENSKKILIGTNRNLNEEIGCLEEIIYSKDKKIKIEDMENDDFIFIYFNKKFIEENLE